jgi:hypothetical protein
VYAEAETSVGGADETATGSLNFFAAGSDPSDPIYGDPQKRIAFRAKIPEAVHCHPRSVVHDRPTGVV